MSCIYERFRPDTMDKFVGNSLAKKRVHQWMKGGRCGVLIITGGSGVGKTSLARISLGGRSVTTFDPSSVRLESGELLTLSRQSLRSPLDGSGSLALLVDDYQACPGVKGGDLLAIATHVPRCPLVVTCRELTDPSLKKLVALHGALHVCLAPPTMQDTSDVLTRVCRAIKGTISSGKMKHIYNTSNGDLRAATIQVEVEATYNVVSEKLHRGVSIVTSATDSPMTGAAERGAVVACRLMGLPRKSCPHTITETSYEALDASGAVASDPVRSAGVVFDLGLDMLQKQKQRSAGQGLGMITTWGKVCDDLSIADILERRGGGLEGHELVATTMGARCCLEPQRLSMMQVTRVPSLFLKGTPSSTLQACAKALYPATSSDAWQHPLKPILLAQPHRLGELARSYQLPPHHVHAVAKAYGITPPAEAFTPTLERSGGKTKKRRMGGGGNRTQP